MLGVCRMISKNTGLNVDAIRFIVIIFLLFHFLTTLLVYGVLGLFVTPEDRL